MNLMIYIMYSFKMCTKFINYDHYNVKQMVKVLTSFLHLAII